MNRNLGHAAELEELVSLRRKLHANPELSRNEFETASFLKEYLAKNARPDLLLPLAGAAFAAVYNSGSPGSTVLLRAELDALPIHEKNQDLAYRSKKVDVSHKCGHDGHMAILVGVARKYSKERPACGKVVLLFQHDEETGTGARECCEHENFSQLAPDYAFALHNFPGFPRHEILCRSGVFMSSVCCFALKFNGSEAHSAMPENGTSPATTLAEVTLATQDVQDEFDRPNARALIVPVHSKMGVPSSGVAPGSGELYLTLRASNDSVIKQMRERIVLLAQKSAADHGLEMKVQEIERFSATINDSRTTELVRDAARLSQFSLTEMDHPLRAGEDFGEFTSRVKGSFFGIGAGLDCPELHNPDYDFPDDLIPTGISMFSKLVERCLTDDRP